MDAAAQEKEAPAGPEHVAEEEVDRFERWFLTIGEQPLTRYERAILKTYLVQRQLGTFESVVA